MKHLVIRADASPAIGSGHVVRCLALAEQWCARGGFVTFVGLVDGALRQQIEAVASVRDASDSDDGLSAVEEEAGRTPRTWVVLDGYRFAAPYHRRIRAAGHPLLVVDDTAHLAFYEADILLNQNLAADRLPYRTARGTRRLLGPRFALLRRQFLTPFTRTIPPRARRLLVTFGGSDPCRLSPPVTAALAARDQWDELRVIVGSLGRVEELEAVARRWPVVRVVHAPTDMASQLRWADLAVSAAGSTCWEMAHMGLPAALVVVADNQSGIAAAAADAGIARLLGEAATLDLDALGSTVVSLASDAAARQAMADTGRDLVDGAGAERVVAHMWDADV